MTDLRQMVGSRVVMTGGAANIGRAAAVLMARHGARIVIGDIDVDATGETARLVEAEGGEAHVVHTDVSDEHAVEHLIDTAVERLGGLDVGFFNAGLQRSGRVTEFPVQEWDALFAVNPRHCFLAAKHATPHLQASGDGVIVLTASLAAVKGGPGMTGYSASKGAIVGFGRALAAELAPDVRVNTICPGWIDTPFNEPAITYMGGRQAQEQAVSQMVPLGRQGTPEEIAAAVLYLASSASSYMTGQILLVDGGVA
ncbi:SDR family NAD(P)-dependent oxidoreductase [Geodermatophilus sp. DSM 44513]|uniref:SDR family NAD(P)-dependent oxidoreductase n=1 Tax=Geodermatophilus sp. DSM 44513 TaxID=1528104 RepID=UPI0012808BF4|nr:SDR family NAD(P)-dependent oxidoreductase [Geodermatophilus sp. DSM 44513]WNV75083.1 SDR family NAD(P)-dependent oxidoreductase [Geodermatophilus sp. DSM 44513]